MIHLLSAILGIFPVSFLAYTFSERMIATHESRVGVKIQWTDFVWQTWVDAVLEVKTLVPRWHWLLYALQFSVIFLFDLDLEYLVFIYLAVNGFALAHAAKMTKNTTEQIEADRIQVRYAIGTAIAALCAFGCFTVSTSTSLPLVHWSWLELFYLVPFQLSGMMLFGEHPFEGLSKHNGWIGSARFYAWSMLGAQLFLGGGDYFIDLHVKSAFLYLAFRICGIYFPRFQQRDLLRISILYLFPITGLIWIITLLLYGMIQSGVTHV